MSTPKLPTVLASGASEKGVWATSATNYSASGPTQYAYAAISFPVPAPAAPTTQWIPSPGAYSAPTQACPGNVTAPAAAPGYLCIYDSSAATAPPTVFDPATPYGTQQGAGRYGAILAFAEAPYASVYAYGTWAVTAPSKRK
ncbi:MAG: hypothetical protein ACYDHH_11315 [Solirubrobacteraceae bacterium]